MPKSHWWLIHQIYFLVITSCEILEGSSLKLQTTNELKDFICHEITAITEPMINQALQKFSVRLQDCITH